MIFDMNIKEKISIYGYWLLLVNKYFNYVNLKFLNYTDKNQIIVLVLFFYAIY